MALLIGELQDTRRRPIPVSVRRAVFRRQAYLCANPLCARLAAELHHIQPVACGGTNEPSNLVGLCWPCHHLGVHGKSGDLEVAGAWLLAGIGAPRISPLELLSAALATDVRWDGAAVAVETALRDLERQLIGDPRHPRVHDPHDGTIALLVERELGRFYCYRPGSAQRFRVRLSNAVDLATRYADRDEVLRCEALLLHARHLNSPGDAEVELGFRQLSQAFGPSSTTDALLAKAMAHKVRASRHEVGSASRAQLTAEYRELDDEFRTRRAEAGDSDELARLDSWIDRSLPWQPTLGLLRRGADETSAIAMLDENATDANDPGSRARDLTFSYARAIALDRDRRPQEALAAVESVRREYGAIGNYEQTATVHVTEGDLLWKLGSVSQAERSYRRALRTDERLDNRRAQLETGVRLAELAAHRPAPDLAWHQFGPQA